MEFSSHLLLLIFYDFALDIFFQILQHQKLCALKVTRVFSLHIISQKKLVKIFGRKKFVNTKRFGTAQLSITLHFHEKKVRLFEFRFKTQQNRPRFPLRYYEVQTAAVVGDNAVVVVGPAAYNDLKELEDGGRDAQKL